MILLELSYLKRKGVQLNRVTERFCVEGKSALFFLFVKIGWVFITLERECHSNQWPCPKDAKKGKGLDSFRSQGQP